MTGIISQLSARLGRPGKLAALCLVGCLSSCSLVVTGYNNAPRWLVFTWVNPHLDLTAAQEQQVLTDLQSVLAWHRQTQLPAYRLWIQRMQSLAPQNITADQVCRLVDDARNSLPAVMAKLELPLADLFLTLKPHQLTNLRDELDTNNQKWRREWKIDQPRSAQWLVQAQKGQDNAERFYGRLDKAQRQLVLELATASGFEPSRSDQERLRQQSDALSVMQRIVTEQADRDQAQQLVQGWLQRMLNPPNPSDAQYRQKRQRTQCEAVAQLHNTTSPAQRANAVAVLKGYEADLNELITPPQ